ncbi:Arylsulfatase A [Polaromonas sp. OV174]|uniref:sulfatase-like hydrolase/transferase n=1 Tax=Polaromonas sp. OV174 TaxID=1855300 RepID=UPI0008F44349|nr:sulfatase-like hydrolase/transferase [Polaromonas sp. OV174]SFB83693.1 Arylsulfatase A [Polaromonas sp. OV174]
MTPKHPNVLFVMVDQWPGKLLRTAGHPRVLTPTLDHLARLGTRYSRAYSECPICIPARRTVMTGTSSRTHGDRSFAPAMEMPALPTMAQSFRDGGYQAYAVGKMHVFPQRDRMGFDDILLAEEGRPQLGSVDDYDIYLSEQGVAGEQFLHGMNNNDYLFRPWHLPERMHVTNWTTREMAKTIKRRDKRKPGFWHVSYTHPHPPLVPLESYLNLYERAAIDLPLGASWAGEDVPHALQTIRDHWYTRYADDELQAIRRAFYALCTHIDHQLRVLIGTLREEQLLEDTVILVCSDHGDMLGDFGLWAKRLFYEGAANIPMLLVGPSRDARIGVNRVDDRLVGLQDVMPSLLDLAGLPVPASVEGISIVGNQRREVLYGECKENALATRMAHDGRHKLIWYPAGNVLQLFDLETDPGEACNLIGHPDRVAVEQRLTRSLMDKLWGGDLDWVKDGRLVGMPRPAASPGKGDRHFGGQRGQHYPQPPLDDPARMVGSPG